MEVIMKTMAAAARERKREREKLVFLLSRPVVVVVEK